MKKTILLLIILSFGCKKTEIPKVDIRQKYTGQYVFDVTNHYSYMDAKTVNGQVIEYMVDTFYKKQVKGTIDLGKNTNELIVHWGDENISFQYYDTESKQYLSTTMTTISLSDDESHFDYNYQNTYFKPFISKDSIYFSLVSNSFKWTEVIGHKI